MIKKTLLVLSSIAISLFAGKAATNDPIRILCVGDSITAGYTDNSAWTVPFEFGYRSGLLERLVQAGYKSRILTYF